MPSGEAALLAGIVLGGTGAIVIGALLVWFAWQWCRAHGRYEAIRDADAEVGLGDLLQKQREAEARAPTVQDIAELDCRMAVRQMTALSFVRALPEIGCCPDKHHFLVHSSDPAHLQREQLAVLFARPCKCVFPFTDGIGQIVSRLLARMRHPFLHPTTLCMIDSSAKQQVVLCQPFKPQGSLKDRIYDANALLPYNRKYASAGRPLPDARIALYGRQILEGLVYFEQINFPYGQLTTANVMLDNNVCRLAGYENSVFGLRTATARLLRPYALRCTRPAGKIAPINVLQFAHVLFEMGTGLECPLPLIDDVPPTCSRAVREVIDYILQNVKRCSTIEDDVASITSTSTVSSAPRLPGLAELIAHPFFQQPKVVSALHPADLSFNAAPLDDDMEGLLYAVRAKRRIGSSKQQRLSAAPSAADLAGSLSSTSSGDLLAYR